LSVNIYFFIKLNIALIHKIIVLVIIIVLLLPFVITVINKNSILTRII
jgi:hypothetical protein